MNYLKQVLAFNDRLLIKPLSSGQIALWHALMDVNNKCKWIKWFSAPNRTLEALCGLSRQGIVKARNALKQEGLIDFKTNGTKATSYTITKLYTSSYSGQYSIQDSTQDSIQDSVRSGFQTSSTLNKENKTKQNKIKQKETAAYSSVDKTKDSSAVSYWLTQVNPEEAPMIMESIDFWVKDFGGQDEIVILAIDEMLENGAKSYNYLSKILKSWETKKLDTPEKVKKHLSGYYNKRKNDNNQKGGSMSDWDELL